MLLIKDLPEYLTPLHIKQVLRIVQRQAYQLTKTNDIQNMKLGNINLYSKEEFIKWLEGGNLK